MSNRSSAMKFALLVVAAALVLWSQCSEGRASANAAPPGWANVTADPVSPEAAESYYSQRARVLTLTAPAPVEASATEETSEITELARGLLHDPKLIYDYVHNHIDYVPYFGSLKGATLTYLDGSGNDCDQASLLIALLRASNFTAQYQYGTVTYPTGPSSPLANWVGSEDNYQNIIASGGIPIQGSGGWQVGRVWAKLSISGTDYLLDPAFKTYQTGDKIDIGQALGYDRDELLAAADGIVTDDYVQNLNEAALNAKLTEYAMNFVNTIRAQHPNDAIEDILGRRTVVQEETDELPTTLPYPYSLTATWDDVPADRTATLRVEHAGIDHTFQIPELGGGRLTITYASGDNHPELRLDGELIASGYPTTAGVLYDLVLSVDHPYAANGGTYCDQTTTYYNKSGATYAIVYNFGGSSEAIIAKRQKKADEYIADGLPEDSEPSRGEALNIAGLSWLRQVRLGGDMASGLWDVVEITHHRVGRMAQESNCYIDVATAVSSTVPKVYGSGKGLAAFYSVTTMASAMEHAVVEQSLVDSNAVSTVKCLQIANSRNLRIFWATCANFDSIVRPQLQNYTTSELNNFSSSLCSGQVAWYLLPQDGRMVVDSWSGTGYVERSGVGDSVGMIIYGGLSGGYCTDDGCYIILEDLDGNLYVMEDPSLSGWDEHEYSEEPVEMSSGAYTHSRTDLSLGGSAPLGLVFSRSYNSGRNMSPGPLGYGWTHSLDLHLNTSSDPGPPLGARLPADASGLVAALYATLDLHTAEDNVQGWTVSALVDKWAADLLIGNCASAQLGGKAMPYIRLADGTYQAPPGVTTGLVDNHDGTYALVERFGTRVNFGTDGNAVSLVDVDGNTMSFAYTSGALTQAQDAFGRSIALAYSDGRIASVSDSAGRSVSFTYDSGKNLVSYTDPESKAWTYGYDPAHHMTSLTDPLAVTTATNTYDSQGRVASQTVPRQSGTATYDFYFSGFRNVEEDPLDNQTVYFYDGQSRLVGTQDALGNRTTREYDGQGQMTEATDERENKTAYAYDGNDNLATLTNARLEAASYEYDPLFRLTTTTDPAHRC